MGQTIGYFLISTVICLAYFSPWIITSWTCKDSITCTCLGSRLDITPGGLRFAMSIFFRNASRRFAMGVVARKKMMSIMALCAMVGLLLLPIVMSLPGRPPERTQ